MPSDALLPANALSGLQIGISVSDSADLARLGLLETHFRLAVGEIARCVLVSGGHLAYGGHLRPDGYTTFLIQELHRFSRRDRPLHLYLPWSEHRAMTLNAIREEQVALGLFGEMQFLGPKGEIVDPAANRMEGPAPVTDEPEREESLTALRRYMAQQTQGRILIGGNREGFLGHMPGVVEEALMAIDQGQPLYLAGGFGGVTADIVRALGVDDMAWLPEPDGAALRDPRLVAGLERLVERAGETKMASLQNGLDEAENRRLAASHRPSEIAALLSLGLGRRVCGSPQS